SDHGQAEYGTEQRWPGDAVDHTGDDYAPERAPSPLSSSPPTKQAINPLPPTACAAAKHAAANATIGTSTQCSLIQPCRSANRSIKVVNQVSARPTISPIPISSTTTQATCSMVPPSIWVPTASPSRITT